MKCDFQSNIHKYDCVPISGVNRPLQEFNIDQVKFRAGSSRRVHHHAWIGTSPAAARESWWYKAHA